MQSNRNKIAHGRFYNIYKAKDNVFLIKELVALKQLTRIDHCITIIQILRQRRKIIQQIQGIYQKTNRCMKYFEEPIKDWRNQKFNDKCNLSSKILNKSEILIRFDGEMTLDLFNLCSMIYQTDLYHSWVPFCSQSKDIKTLNRASKLAFLKFNLPFISNRQGYFYGQGIDRLEYEDTVVIYCEGVTSNQFYQQKFDMKLTKNQNSVELDLKFFICQIKLVSNNVYKMRAFSHIDIKMYFIPEFILGFFSKKIGIFLFDKIINNALHLKDTQWEKRIQQNNNGFYNWLDQTLKTWKAMHQDSNKL